MMEKNGTKRILFRRRERREANRHDDEQASGRGVLPAA